MSDRPKKRRHVGSYTLGNTIGQGAFGKVKLGTDIFSGEKVAVKIIRNKNVKTEKEKKTNRKRTKHITTSTSSQHCQFEKSG